MKRSFSTLRVKGFRHLRDLDLSLKPLNVLIGANGVGKTSILEVIRLLAASAEGKLQETINKVGGFGSVLTLGQTEPMQFAVAMPVENEETLEYGLSLQQSGTGYWLPQECLSQIGHKKGAKGPPFKFIDSAGNDIRYFDPAAKKLQPPNWEYKPLETSLAQVPKMFREAERFRNALASSTLYHVLDVSPRAPVRLPQPMRPVLSPGQNGEDLVSCLYFLRETERDRFEAIEDTLRAAFHNFERMDFPPAAAGSLTLAWRERPYPHPLYAHQLSEGSLRFLCLVTLLQSPELPTVTLIDEPEVSLHPEMLRLLAELLREAADRTQLIVATHSERLVRFLEPEEIIACDLDESGATRAARASELDLAAWLEEYTLDQLWGLGRLGGRA
ncbi:MAG: AAA family ATPase [Zoogloeaceae bacterium]|jgi:predicted ATPase|nr:AAA family ATPase [Zoogloeaceae bacterium]